MQSFVYHVKNQLFESLFEKEYEVINSAKSVLIQVFSGQKEEDFRNLFAFIKEKFPDAVTIASSTDGEIYNDKVLLQSSVVSVSLFDSTELNGFHIKNGDSFKRGVLVAKKLVTSRTKLLIVFGDGLNCNGEELLNGINEIAPRVKVAGGLSGDNAEFKKCLVGFDGILYDKGVVAVALDSDILQVESFYNFGWRGIGIKHTITKSDKNRVYTIDNLSAIDFYRKYLGRDITSKLPSTGVEFPLIIEKNGFKVARAVLSKHSDGSLSFAGNLLEGTQVSIGVGNINEITRNPIYKNSLYVETFYIYSCMARRRLIPDLIENEIYPFARLAPTSGFFTYGEFYTARKAELLNQTLTAVSLTESQEKRHTIEHTQKGIENTTLLALSNILDVTTQELYKETKRIEAVKKELMAKNSTFEFIQHMASIGSWELNLLSKKISWSKESFEIYKRDPSLGAPSYLEFMDMLVDEEDRNKLLKAQEALIDDKIHSAEVKMKSGDGKILTIVESGKLIFKDSKPYKIVGVSIDITELRVKDSIIFQQSKLAQMGEMVNMIAHQWRQPLNAVSASVIKLSMQDQMGLASSEKIQETTSFVSDMVQNMSKTINDFMDFTKPTDKKDLVKFQAIMDDILRLMGAQLKNHDISFVQDIEENCTISTYKKDLEHVLINLFSNSRDAFDGKSIETKHIKIEVFLEGEDCIIKFSDNAGGISPEVIERIFEPYFTTKEQGKGTGLGLYMSKKLIKNNLDGDISVENIEDGAEFTIVLKDSQVVL